MKVYLGPYRKNKDRKINIKIDKWDTWSMDHTLAMIIAPMLEQLKATNHGYPAHITEEDWPLGENYQLKEDEDSLEHARWEQIQDEMIWAMKQIANDSDEEAKFFTHEAPSKEEQNDPNNVFNQLECRHKYVIDHAGLEAYHKRIKRGCELFGKYFQSLWD